jgi:hypothetical protein
MIFGFFLNSRNADAQELKTLSASEIAIVSQDDAPNGHQQRRCKRADKPAPRPPP